MVLSKFRAAINCFFVFLFHFQKSEKFLIILEFKHSTQKENKSQHSLENAVIF